MKEKDTSKPLMLYLPESIYLNLIQIKNNDPNINNIGLIERFIATDKFIEIKNGNFHNNLFIEIKANNFFNFETIINTYIFELKKVYILIMWNCIYNILNYFFLVLL